GPRSGLTGLSRCRRPRNPSWDLFPAEMMTTTGDSGSRQELTTELAALDRQLRDLSEQWEAVERTISEKIRRRRELIARQEETNEDHAEEINRLQSDV